MILNNGSKLRVEEGNILEMLQLTLYFLVNLSVYCYSLLKGVTHIVGLLGILLVIQVVGAAHYPFNSFQLLS